MEGVCDVLDVGEGKKSKLDVYHEGEIDKKKPPILSLFLFWVLVVMRSQDRARVVEPGVLLDWPVHFPDLDVSTNNHLLTWMECRKGWIYLHCLSPPFPEKPIYLMLINSL